MSKLLPIKHLKASIGDITMGSPLTLNDVFTRIGQPEISLNFFINL